MSVAVMHGSMLALWWIIAIGLIAGVAVGVTALVRSTSPDRRSDLDTLRHRYAVGEIDDEEYRRRRRLLDEP